MNKVLLLAVASLAALAAAQTSAATVTQTFFTGSAPFTTGPATAQSPSFTDVISVAPFDQTGGNSLNSVVIAINGSSSVTANVSNTRPAGGAPANFSNVVASTAVTASVGSAAPFFSQTLTSFDFSGTVSPQQMVSGGLKNTPFTQVTTLTGTATAPFLSGGTSQVQLSFSASALVASGTGVGFVTFFGGNADILSTISVTYDFSQVTPPLGVPEPASLMLVGLSIVAVGVIRCRSQGRVQSNLDIQS